MYDFLTSFDREFNILHLRGGALRTPTLPIRGDISSADPGHFVFSGCGAVGSEDCQWQFARELSDGNWLANREIPGSPKVTAPLDGIHVEYRDVAQLVARTAGGGEAAGSSPVIPTKKQNTWRRVFFI